MKSNNTISAAANLKGMAKHTYNPVMSAMAEDNDLYMGHTFAALTDGAKAIALQSGHYIAAYYRGERKDMAAEEPTTTEPTNTPSTMNANETTEFSELTHAGQCLDIYLHNTAEIYNRYTVPAINAVVKAVKCNGWQLPKEEAIKNLTFWTSWQDGTEKAIQAAARLVKRCDHLTPTAKDIEQVTRNYAAYIVDCAKYEIEK